MSAYRRAKRRMPASVRRRLPRARRAAADPLTTSEATDAVFSRLTPEEVKELVVALPSEQQALVRDADPGEQRRLLVALGIDRKVPAFVDKIAYGAPHPPPGVPARERGPMSVARAYHQADIVVDALRTAGVEPWYATPALELGCSSGAVVRALAAVYPAVGWHGCDPDAEAIAWAQGNDDRVAFAHCSPRPPLPHADGFFDYVYSLSFWPRLDRETVLAWLGEMHRVIRPGGHLILAAHGSHSLEWLARQVRGRWAIVSFAAERGPGDEDVIVLSRVPGLPAVDPRDREVRTPRPAAHEVSDALYSRLGEEDREAIVAAMDPEHRALHDGAPEGDRKAIALALGLHHGVGGVAEKTGLSTLEPPEDVHAMARGPLATGGGYWYADLVVRALRAGGVDPRSVRRALDFGASSGRVLRPLAVVYPEVEWHGCDPNADAIAWAREHLAPIRFEVSPQRPPLPYDDGTFDFVYAISIWSHFGEAAALAWLDEMRRVTRPDGLLIITTHGYPSLAYYAAIGERSRDQLARIDRSLYRTGFWYEAEFGDEGDWGVKDPEWGTAYLSAEWLLERCARHWDVVDFEPGEVASNQDLYVLRRR